jgi:peptidoglycan/xylan/chitin deacetylase (PgdA/CDA1 family)
MALKRIAILLLISLALLVLKGLPLEQAPTLAGQAQNTQSFFDRRVAQASPMPPASSTSAPIASPAATIGSTPTQTDPASPTPLPTPEWIWHEPGEVIIPILLYHHIDERTPASRYFLPPDQFEEQIHLLQRWGYTSISLPLLLEALTEGAYLPPRSVIITFDDGNRDVYTHAYPILKRFGYTGMVYVIASEIGVGKYMDARQLRQLAKHGWEIGSHSWTHASLRNPAVNLEREIDKSRQEIEEVIDISVESFSFPYGLTSKYVTGLVKEAGYKSAVGLGGSFRHTKKTRFYLSRIEIRSNYDLKQFAALLPWSGDLKEDEHPSNREGHETGD